MTVASRWNTRLTSLIGSRICHDLISPLGAISNGVELLAMAGNTAGPEMSLIAESVENANARIRFFRVAYGNAAPGQKMGRAEILSVLGSLAKGGRQQIIWQPPGDVGRDRVKLAFLCLQCLETALPWGGRISVTEERGDWRLAAEAPRIRDLGPLWRLFDTPEACEDLAAADIQFALAPLWAAEIGHRLSREAQATRLAIGFAPR